MYSLIYADPPWLYRDARTHTSTGMARSAYECLPVEAICALPVPTITNPDCFLALWATLPKLPEALQVVAAWGFRYINVGFVWVKLNPKGVGLYSGLGHWTNGNAEVVLFGRKGNPKRIARNVKQIIIAPRGRHSAKPPEVRERLVQLLGDIPRIELFAREQPKGWDVWGDECGHHSTELPRGEGAC